MYHGDTKRSMGLPPDRPLPPAKITGYIRAKISPELHLYWTEHAKEQLAERDLIMGDVFAVLRHGFIYEKGVPATQAGCFKYQMEGTTPNSNGRTVRIVVIPNNRNELKIVSVMWRDEPLSKG
jgi:hypothetical protein